MAISAAATQLAFTKSDRAWRRSGGTRFAKKMRRAYRKAHPGVQIVTLTDRQAQNRDVADRKLIVFLPKVDATASVVSAASVGAPGRMSVVDRREAVRERAGALLHEVLVEVDAEETVTMAGFASASRHGKPNRRKIPAFRTLPAIGAILIDPLSDAAITRLKQRGADVFRNERVVLPRPVTGQASPAAPSVGTAPWHLRSVGVIDEQGERLSELQSLDMSPVLIGMIDTGVDAQSAGLTERVVWFGAYRDQIIRRTGEVSRNHQPMDYATAKKGGRHGTNVAALIAGKTSGVIPTADLAVAAVLTSYNHAEKEMTGSIGDVTQAVNDLLGYAEQKGRFLVLNASLTLPAFNPVLKRIAEDRSEAIAIVAAIGNDALKGMRGGSPADYRAAIGVGATDRAGEVAPFSAIIGIEGAKGGAMGREKPDLYAPGHRLDIAETGMREVSGTSFATPIVSGLLAIYAAQARATSTSGFVSVPKQIELLTANGVKVAYPATHAALTPPARVSVRYVPRATSQP